MKQLLGKARAKSQRLTSGRRRAADLVIERSNRDEAHSSSLPLVLPQRHHPSFTKSTQAPNPNNGIRPHITTRSVIRPELAGGITFNNAYFFYPKRPEVPVLRNLQLSIDDGERIAIIVSSGSSKSTLATPLPTSVRSQSCRSRGSYKSKDLL